LDSEKFATAEIKVTRGHWQQRCSNDHISLHDEVKLHSNYGSFRNTADILAFVYEVAVYNLDQIL